MLVLIYGMLNFTPMVLLPPLLQQHAGFPDALIGEIIAARGVGATIGFFLAIFIGRMDPRIGLIGGFALQTISGVWLMGIDLNVDTGTLMANSLVQGIAIGVIWVPLTLVTFSTIGSRQPRRGRRRSTTCCATSARASSSRSASPRSCAPRSANYSRLVEMVNPFNRTPAPCPGSPADGTPTTVGGLAKLSKEIGRQAAMLGYINAFGFYTLCSALAIPLILFVGRRARTL